MLKRIRHMLKKNFRRRCFGLALRTLFVILILSFPATVFAGGYDNALKGLTSYDAVYDVSTGDPKISNIVFWAVKNSYEVDEVKSLSPKIAVVFHGAAVYLLSTDISRFSEEQRPEVVKFQQTLKEMKRSGITLEVCLYAVKVMGVDKGTIIPEIDQVGNGFVSVIGYQNQGYAVVRIP